jgi:hypothetical protein
MLCDYRQDYRTSELEQLSQRRIMKLAGAWASHTLKQPKQLGGGGPAVSGAGGDVEPSVRPLRHESHLVKAAVCCEHVSSFVKGFSISLIRLPWGLGMVVRWLSLGASLRADREGVAWQGPRKVKNKQGANWFTQFAILTWRSFTVSARNKIGRSKWKSM